MILLRFTRCLLPLILLFFTACSTVRSSYISEGYNDNQQSMVKHVRILVYVPEDKENIAPLIADIASDMIRLKTNYFVHGVKIIRGDWREELGGDGGIILFTATVHGASGNRVNVEMISELIGCPDGKVFWSASAAAAKRSDDPDLKELTSLYTVKHPSAGKIYAAPLFIIIQDFVDIMPDPQLTDEEIDRRIQLEADME